MKFKHLTGAYVSIAAILLSCLGAISIGFSTWIISQEDSASTNGKINADDINTKIEGVTVSSNSIIEYGHYFFNQGASYEARSTATIIYSISYNGEEIVEDDDTNVALSLSCSLSFGDGTLPLFVKNTYITSIKYNSIEIIEQPTTVFTSNNDAVEFKISETIIDSTYSASKSLEITLSNRMIAKYGVDMNEGTFYLRLEAE